jgi:TDG/mug DNA glycosylase family protein
VSRAEFRAAADAFTRKIERYSPRAVAFLGKAGYAAMLGRPSVPWGRQEETIGGATAWVLPNPSGLNRAFRLEDLVRDYAAFRLALDAEP